MSYGVYLHRQRMLAMFLLSTCRLTVLQRVNADFVLHFPVQAWRHAGDLWWHEHDAGKLNNKIGCANRTLKLHNQSAASNTVQ